MTDHANLRLVSRTNTRTHNMNHVIDATCPSGGDASQIAAAAARRAGTTLAGNMRWHGDLYPAYRLIATTDGRVVRVVAAWD